MVTPDTNSDNNTDLETVNFMMAMTNINETSEEQKASEQAYASGDWAAWNEEDWKNDWSGGEWAAWSTEDWNAWAATNTTDNTATSTTTDTTAEETHRNRTPAEKGGGINDETNATVRVDDWGDLDCREALISDTTWENLKLSNELIQGIYSAGFSKPSHIQAAALPLICAPSCKNMIGQAASGSGKTATFSLGMLSSLDTNIDSPQALILTPTRELANQTEEVITELGKFMKVKVLKLLPQGERMERGNAKSHVVVGTPGKIHDLMKKRILNTDLVKVFILDEADVLLNQESNMGRDVVSIRKWLPSSVQCLFFSATYPDVVRDFAKQYVPNAVKISVENQDLGVSAILNFHQKCADENDKYLKLKEIYSCMNIGQSIIFMNSRNSAFKLAKNMKNEGFSVSLICGNQTSGPETIDPKTRDKVMSEFRSGVTKVLIATDVLSRGIDVPAVTLVVNYEQPLQFGGPRGQPNSETFLHRIGRTGRFGAKGCAVHLVTNDEEPGLMEIAGKYGITSTDLKEDFERLESMVKKAYRR